MSEPCDECDGTGVCPPCDHVWVGGRMGGAPDAIESYEYVEYCDLCGMENPGSFVE